jgi:tRNA dimethylallyltransferase
MSNKINNKILVILGPTATGKTKLGVNLACKYDGEIINADSRQVYKGMDIGTGKDLDEYCLETRDEKGDKKVIDIPYHLIDVVHPNTSFNLAKYQKMAYKKIEEVLKRGKLPILVGGTGLYIQAVVEGFNLADSAPDKKERSGLEEKTSEELLRILKNINPDFANRVNESDQKNKRRLIRYIEICRQGQANEIGKNGSPYEFLLLGVARDRRELDKRIYKRLQERLEKEGMVEEVRDLHIQEKVSWKRLKQFGLEYKYVAKYLQGELEYEEMKERLYIAIRRFSKKQMTWFERWQKHGADINWTKEIDEADKLIQEFLQVNRVC